METEIRDRKLAADIQWLGDVSIRSYMLPALILLAILLASFSNVMNGPGMQL
jgi:hypothetical protein